MARLLNFDGLKIKLKERNGDILRYLNRKSNYDKYPVTNIIGYDDGIEGNEAIAKKILEHLGDKKIIVVDCYPGVNDEEVLTALIKGLKPDRVIKSADMFYDEAVLTSMMSKHLTDDRVRGIMYYGQMRDFIDEKKRSIFQTQVSNCAGICLIYGVGASLITKGDLLVYADLARWEIQLRYRKGMPNFKCHNNDEDILRKYKRGFFIEWRIADKLKRDLYDEIDFYLDTNKADQPKMISGEAFRAGLKQISRRPFRLVPYFDPGVWGGQWMKEVCGLDSNEDNFAWSFDGVPEENSLYLKYGDIVIETPAMNVVQYQPENLLGEKNFARFGAEFPIRFDFLDTMEGQNLSLQVHPLTEYIKSHFGMTYTQDESYYILDCQEGGGVFLGLKEDIQKEEMINELKRAQAGEGSFNVQRYINFFEAKKHDHYLIPAGTVHCSSANCMVLEVSATPYIFTFKLWDWDRLGLDGLPRPIHIEDGKKNIQWNRTTTWVKDNLVNHFELIENNDDYTEIKTGLHELEFIETRVITSRTKTFHQTNDGVNMLNLVEGTSAVIESPINAFDPFILHYVETVIIPASVKQFTIRPEDPDEEIKVLKAYVRN